MDIVERLVKSAGARSDVDALNMVEAADEIERLRADQNSLADDVKREIAELAAENERLRAALKKVREYVVRVDGTMSFVPPENRLTKPDLDLIDAALFDSRQPAPVVSPSKLTGTAAETHETDL